MDLDSAMNADNKEQLQVEETDVSCKVDFTEIAPLTRDTDGSCTTEGVNGDWFGKVREKDLAGVKQEPDDVSCFPFIFSLSQQNEFVCNISDCTIDLIFRDANQFLVLHWQSC